MVSADKLPGGIIPVLSAQRDVGLANLSFFSVLDLPPWPPEITLQYGKSTMFNFTAYFAFAMIHYCTARWILRPYLRDMRIFQQEIFRFRSAAGMIILILSCSIVYLLLRMFWYAIDTRLVGEAPKIAVLLVIGATVTVIAFTAIYYTAYYLFRDLERMTVKLRELAGMKRGQLHSRIPIASPYESGELAMAFNALQSRFEKEYARIDNDMKLALHVQEQLFAHRPEEFKEWRFDGACSWPLEVGGGFYDVLPLTDHRAAIAAGSVTGKGLPSALVMSALLMMLRTKVQDAASAGELLTELNASLADILPDGLHIHMAIGIIDSERGMLEYALAGNMCARVVQSEPYLEGGPHAEPLGSRYHRQYDNRQFPLQRECIVMLHASGMAVPSGEDVYAVWEQRAVLRQGFVSSNQSMEVQSCVMAFRAGRDKHGGT